MQRISSAKRAITRIHDGSVHVLERVDRGAAVSVGPSWYDAGYEAAGLMVEILEGTDPADLELIQLEGHDLAFNLSAAVKQGVEIPDDMLQAANHIVE